MPRRCARPMPWRVRSASYCFRTGKLNSPNVTNFAPACASTLARANRKSAIELDRRCRNSFSACHNAVSETPCVPEPPVYAMPLHRVTMVTMGGCLRSDCMRFAVAVLGTLLIVVRASAVGVGFRPFQVPDPPGKPLEGGVSYPSSSDASAQSLGPFYQDVALNGTIVGAKLPVVFI